MIEEQQYFVEDEAGFEDFLAMFKRKKRLALIVAGVLFVIGAIVIVLLPASYKSTATILLEEPEVPETLVQTTVTTYAAEQLEYIKQRVMTRSNLASIIEKFDLYADKRRYTPTLLLSQEVQNKIHMVPITADLTDPRSGRPTIITLAFTLGFEDPNPKTAQQVANELVSLFMEENVRTRTVQTAETREFLGDEAARLETRVKDLELQVARFKEDNEGSLPETAQIRLAAMQRIDSELLNLDREIRSLEETRIIIDAQLAQVDPTQPTILPDGSTALSPQDQLKSLQTKLAMLKGTYNEGHPDVVRTKREIEALRQQSALTADYTEITAALVDARTDLARARESYGPEHPEVIRLERLVSSLEETAINARDEIDDVLMKPDNPAYIQLVTQKETLRADEMALRRMKADMQDRLEEYESAMLKGPLVEQELAALQRQLQSATTQYYAIRDREFGAEMGEALETQSKGERFVLVEPPNFPLEAASPNRALLFIVLLIFAPAAGIGVVLLKQAVDKSIWGVKSMAAAAGMPPIAEIPLIVTEGEQERMRRIRLVFLSGIPLTILTTILIVHFLIKPLDVIWFILMRRLGM